MLYYLCIILLLSFHYFYFYSLHSFFYIKKRKISNQEYGDTKIGGIGGVGGGESFTLESCIE